MDKLEFDIERGKEVIEKLHLAYNSNEGIFGETDLQNFSNMLPKGIIKGSNEHLIWLALISSIDYSRNAKILWDIGKNLFENPNTKWIFDVSDEKTKNEELLLKVLKENRLTKNHGKDTKIWLTIIKGINEIFSGDIKNFIEKECHNNAPIFYFNIGIKYKRFFPYLSGPKILSMYIRIIEKYAGIQLDDINKLPIPVDIHVARATINTTCQNKKIETGINQEKERIDYFWEQVAKQTRAVQKKEFDECLFNLSRFGCTNYKNKQCKKYRQCPVGKYCYAINNNYQIKQGEKGIKIN